MATIGLDKLFYAPITEDENEEEDLINVAVIGKPNAGKSSLINKIAGEQRVIVSDIAGTTRDIIEEHISLNGVSLNIIDTHIADLSLRSDVRETRFMGTYRHKFAEFTDGAFGFVYRVNPNNTNEFGNESVFMMKLTHRLGI